MAGKLVKDLSEDFLNCCICMSQFKTPKMLPCIHSFCEECIAKYAAKQDGNEVPCPTCRKVCNLPETGVKGLQTNFHLINLAEKVNLLEKLTSKEKRASVCDSCKNPEIVAFCVDCNIVICSKCKSHHALFPLLQSHSVIPLKKLNDPKFQQEWKNARSPYCALHSSEKLRFYCKTCSKLICRDCTIVLHSKPDHECTEAATQFNESKEELTILVENSMGQMEKAMDYIKEGKVGFTLLNASKKKIEIEITNHCNEMIKETQKVYDKQKQDMLDDISTRIDPVEAQLQLATDWMKRMQTTQEMTRQIIKENNPWELMAMSFDLTSAFATLRVDNSAYQWGRSQLQHEIAFSPGQISEIKIGAHYRQGYVVVSDKQNAFYSCTFDECKKCLHITKVTKINGKVEIFKPHQWQYEVPDGARLVATVGSNQCQVLFVALGPIVVELDCSYMGARRSFTVPTDINTVVKSMEFNAHDRYLFITSTSQVMNDDKSINYKATCILFGMNQSHPTNTFTFSPGSSIESIYVGPNDIFFYTGNFELITYNHAAYKRGYLLEAICYNIDPPKALLNITGAKILHCHVIGTHNTYQQNTNINIDNVNIFILWNGRMINAGKNTDERAWTLKEYNTKDKNVLGDLKYVNGNAPKSPSALQCQQTGNGGMQIHLCDDLGNITTYHREPYNGDNVVPYTMM